MYSSRQLPRLLDELGVQPDRRRVGIAAAPLRFHPLEEVAGDLHPEPPLVLPDERRHRLVQQCLVLVVHDLGAPGRRTAGAHGERDPAVVERHGRFDLALNHLEQAETQPWCFVLVEARRAPDVRLRRPERMVGSHCSSSARISARTCAAGIASSSPAR